MSRILTIKIVRYKEKLNNCVTRYSEALKIINAISAKHRNGLPVRGVKLKEISELVLNGEKTGRQYIDFTICSANC